MFSNWLSSLCQNQQYQTVRPKDIHTPCAPFKILLKSLQVFVIGVEACTFSLLNSNNRFIRKSMGISVSILDYVKKQWGSNCKIKAKWNSFRISISPLSIESSYKIKLKSTQWFKRNCLDKNGFQKKWAITLCRKHQLEWL